MGGVLAIFVLLSVALTVLLVTTVKREQKEVEATPVYAEARVHGDDSVFGTVQFHSKGDLIHISAEITGLQPFSKHGFHIFEFGTEDGSQAKILRVKEVPHGCPGDSLRQLGDLGNVEADHSGTASYQRTDPLLRLHGSKSVLGRTIVIREFTDDCASQPDGKSGSVIAHGVVVVADPATERGFLPGPAKGSANPPKAVDVASPLSQQSRHEQADEAEMYNRPALNSPFGGQYQPAFEQPAFQQPIFAQPAYPYQPAGGFGSMPSLGFPAVSGMGEASPQVSDADSEKRGRSRHHRKTKKAETQLAAEEKDRPDDLTTPVFDAPGEQATLPSGDNLYRDPADMGDGVVDASGSMVR